MFSRPQRTGSLHTGFRVTLSLAVVAVGALVTSVSADAGVVAPQSGAVSSSFGGGDGTAEVPGLGTSNWGASMTLTSTGRIVVTGDDDGTLDGTVIAALEQDGTVANWLSDTGATQIERTVGADNERGEAVVADGVGGFYVASQIYVESKYGLYVTHVGVDGLVKSMSDAILVGSWHSTVVDIAVDEHYLTLAVTAITGATDEDLTLLRWGVSTDTEFADLSSAPQVTSVDGGSESYWSRDKAVAVGLQPSGTGSALSVVAGTAYLRPGGTFSHNVGMIARFDSEFALDPSFGSDGVALLDAGDDRHLYVHEMHVSEVEGGPILVAGRRESAWGSGAYDSFVLRLTSDGILDTTFGSDGILIIDSGGSDAAVAVVHTDDRLFVVHSTHSWRGWAVSSWNLNGTERDTDFGEAGYVRSGGSYARVSTAEALPNGLVGLLVMAEDRTWDVIAIDPTATSGGMVGPLIGSVTVDPASAGPGDTVVISMEVSDDTGVGGAYFSLSHSTEGQRNYCTSSLSLASGSVTDGVWSSSCTLPDVVLNGTYEVYPYAEDVLGAWTNMNGQNLIPLRGSFTLDDSADNTAPVIVTDTRTLQLGQNVVVQISEPGTVYLIAASATVPEVSAISLLPSNQWISAAVGAANIDVEVQTTDLSPGEYRLYAADAAGNLAAPDELVVTVVAASTSTTVPTTTVPTTTVPSTTAPTTTAPTTTAPTTTVPSTTAPTTFSVPSVDQIAELTLGEVLSPSDMGAPELIPGSSVMLSVSGFVANETVQIVLASTPRQLGLATADSSGVVTFEATLPLDVPAGSHTLAVYSPVSGQGVRQMIEVGHSPAASTLPATGSGVPWMALMMLACGVAMLAVRRRGSIGAG